MFVLFVFKQGLTVPVPGSVQGNKVKLLGLWGRKSSGFQQGEGTGKRQIHQGGGRESN